MSNLTTSLTEKLIEAVTSAVEKQMERLRVCEAPDCQRAFLKQTRGRFCSTRCQQRMNMRAYRQQKRKA